MDQLPFDTPKNRGGGNTRTPQAKLEIARRENQIVELRLRNISFAAIGRAVGVSKQAAVKAFHKALHRNTDQDISTHHRSELAKLEMEETRYWQALDTHKENWKGGAAAFRPPLPPHNTPTPPGFWGSMRRRNSTSAASTNAVATKSRPNDRHAGPSSRRCRSRNSGVFTRVSTKRA